MHFIFLQNWKHIDYIILISFFRGIFQDTFDTIMRIYIISIGSDSSAAAFFVSAFLFLKKIPPEDHQHQP